MHENPQKNYKSGNNFSKDFLFFFETIKVWRPFFCRDEFLDSFLKDRHRI